MMLKEKIAHFMCKHNHGHYNSLNIILFVGMSVYSNLSKFQCDSMHLLVMR